MANHQLPRRGSAAAVGLKALLNIGSIARVSAWESKMDWRGSSDQFARNIIDPCLRAGLVRKDGDMCEMTPAGRIYLGEVAEVVKAAPAVPVAPAYRPDWRVTPRGLNRQRPTDLARPGSFDYRDIPSRIGSERLAFKSALVVEGDAP